MRSAPSVECVHADTVPRHSNRIAAQREKRKTPADPERRRLHIKALVIGRPQFPLPPEQAPAIVQGALDWYERYKDSFLEFGTFIGGGGFANR